MMRLFFSFGFRANQPTIDIFIAPIFNARTRGRKDAKDF
jgi:hypothetical protein